MLRDQDLPSLQDRRVAARLMFFYKVVEGLVPAISPDAFLLNRKGLNAKFMQKKSRFDSKNIVEIHQSKNTKSFRVSQALEGKPSNRIWMEIPSKLTVSQF